VNISQPKLRSEKFDDDDDDDDDDDNNNNNNNNNNKIGGQKWIKAIGAQIWILQSVEGCRINVSTGNVRQAAPFNTLMIIWVP